MTKSLYNGSPLGGKPPCLICMGPGEGERAQLHLPFGVSVWLCAAHRSDEFQRRRAGRDLVVSLSGAWQASGVMTRRRQRALEAHLARLTTGERGRPSRRPGSYSWPGLRAEAEARWAAGASARVVIDELRARHSRARAIVPARATMYRWFREARWASAVDRGEEAPADLVQDASAR
jgi:hypothetical protein